MLTRGYNIMALVTTKFNVSHNNLNLMMYFSTDE